MVSLRALAEWMNLADRCAGFSLIFSIQDMRIFSPEELGLLFGNAEEDWSRESERSDGIDYDQADLAQRSSMPSRQITVTTSTAVRFRT
jgi:hypothetical protein